MSGGSAGAHDVAGQDAAAANALAALQAGHPFSLLLTADDHQRAAELEAVLDAVAADGRTRIAAVTNPLRAPLTLERLLIQAMHGPTHGAALAGDDAATIRRIASRHGGESRVVLVIDKAETLHPEVLHFLGRNAACFPDGTPRLQVLFVGRPEFQAMLDAPDAAADGHAAVLDAPQPVEPVLAPPPEPARPPLPPSRLPFLDTSLRAQFRTAWNGGIWNRIGIVGGTTGGLAAVAVAVLLATGGNNAPFTTEPDANLLPLPGPAEDEPEPPALRPGPAPDAETAQLRSEFETYLSALGRNAAAATGEQKRAWYQEFLVWRSRTASPRPASGE